MCMINRGDGRASSVQETPSTLPCRLSSVDVPHGLGNAQTVEVPNPRARSPDCLAPHIPNAVVDYQRGRGRARACHYSAVPLRPRCLGNCCHQHLQPKLALPSNNSMFRVANHEAESIMSRQKLSLPSDDVRDCTLELYIDGAMIGASILKQHHIASGTDLGLDHSQ